MRMLHTMLRVRDLNASIAFYTTVLGMKLLRQKDYPAGEFTLAFVGYGDETDHTVLELTHNGFELMIPVMAATLLATAVARHVDGYSIYSARLAAEERPAPA